MNTNTKRHQFQLTCVATEMGCSVKMFHYLPFFLKKILFHLLKTHFPPIYVHLYLYLSTFSVYDAKEFAEPDAAATMATRCIHVAVQYLVFAKYFGHSAGQ